MVDTLQPKPPPIIEICRIILLALIVVAAMAFASYMAPAEAAYRIEVQACASERCILVPTPPTRWDGLYSCQGRLEWVIDEAQRLLAEQSFDLPNPWTVSAQCVPAGDKPRA